MQIMLTLQCAFTGHIKVLVEYYKPKQPAILSKSSYSHIYSPLLTNRRGQKV